MRKKLYLATQNVDVIFASNSKESFNLEKEAKYFLSEEARNHVPSRFQLKEITSMEEIPESWKDCLIWGVDDEYTPAAFLGEEDEEYQQYLRLKKKFEDV